jgi:hypothetical protein
MYFVNFEQRRMVQDAFHPVYHKLPPINLGIGNYVFRLSANKVSPEKTLHVKMCKTGIL